MTPIEKETFNKRYKTMLKSVSILISFFIFYNIIIINNFYQSIIKFYMFFSFVLFFIFLVNISSCSDCCSNVISEMTENHDFYFFYCFVLDFVAFFFFFRRWTYYFLQFFLSSSALCFDIFFQIINANFIMHKISSAILILFSISI